MMMATCFQIPRRENILCISSMPVGEDSGDFWVAIEIVIFTVEGGCGSLSEVVVGVGYTHCAPSCFAPTGGDGMQGGLHR